jgi:hypothetical protein
VHFTSFRFLRQLAHDERLTLRLRGGCMTPHLEEGARVEVRRRRFYLPGDVLVFRTAAGDLAAHRLLGWRRRAFITKGDACVTHDGPVCREAIVGAVTTRVPLRVRVVALAAYARIVARRLLR